MYFCRLHFYFYFCQVKRKKREASDLFLDPVPAGASCARTPRPCLTPCAGAIHRVNGVTPCSDPSFRDLPKTQHSSRDAGDPPGVHRDLIESGQS